MSKIKITAENNIQFEAEGNDLFVQQERKAFIDMISDKTTVKSVIALQKATQQSEMPEPLMLPQNPLHSFSTEELLQEVMRRTAV